MFTGPYHDSYRFWPGLLYFLRSGIYAVTMYLGSYEQLLREIKMLLTSSICILIMILACIFPHGVYKKWSLNILEFSFMLNLCITSAILGFHSHPNHKIYYSVSFAMLVSCGILLYHVYLQIRGTCGWNTCSKWASVCMQNFRKRRHVHDSREGNEHSALLPQPLPAVVEVTMD